MSCTKRFLENLMERVSAILDIRYEDSIDIVMNYINTHKIEGFDINADTIALDYKNHHENFEHRICEHCGQHLTRCGMTTDDGDFYCHEECFADYMDKTYGEHRWMEVEDDGCNGYYMYYDPDKDSTFATGIYYTEWED